MEAGEVKKYYRWNQTSRRGQVEEYMAETEDAVYFSSGRFCSKEQWDSGFLDLISEEEFSQVAPPIEQYANPDLPMSEAEFNAMAGNVIEPIIPVVVIEKSPIRLILEKQKKTVSLATDFNLDVSTPTDKVFELLSMMFDEDEVIEEIINSILDKLDLKTIEEKIRSSVKTSIYKFYNLEENVTSKKRTESVSELAEEK